MIALMLITLTGLFLDNEVKTAFYQVFLIFTGIFAVAYIVYPDK